MTSPIADRDDDDLTTWETAPTPDHPHLALLLGGCLLAVVLVCALPIGVLGHVARGFPVYLFNTMAVVALLIGAGPFLTRRVQTPGYIKFPLVMFNALPLVLVVCATAGIPTRQWSNLILIPVLIIAATMTSRVFWTQLIAGIAVGTTILWPSAHSGIERVLTVGGYAGVILTCAVLTRQAWQELHDRFDKLEERSHTDELTGLLNRRGFITRFPTVRSQAIAAGRPLGMVMIDIDYFSRINAAYGHAFGDTVLQRICSVVRADSMLDESGIVARIGGEELVIVVAGQAGPIADAIRRAVAKAEIHPGLTVSMGIADFDAQTCTGAESLWRLVNLTDSAMYRAKETGRDRIVRVNAGDAEVVAIDAEGWPIRDTTVAPPVRVEPALALRRLAEAAELPAGPVAPPAVDDRALDARLFGYFCLAIGVIGVTAYVWEVAVDPHSPWATAFLVLLGLTGVFGSIVAVLGSRSPLIWIALAVWSLELCTVCGVLATSPEQLEARLMIFCVIEVPVLTAAHALPARWLASQYLVVFLGAAVAAYTPQGGLSVDWFHQGLSLAVVISVAPAVLFWLHQRRDEASSRLRLLTATDPLTGVANRGGLERAVLAGDENPAVRVLALNINGFKALNDTFGHGFGDQVLTTLADTLIKVVREYERGAGRHPSGRSRNRSGPKTVADIAATHLSGPVISRTGGDRFVVVYRNSGDRTLIRLIKRAVTLMPLDVTVSLGESEGVAGSPASLWALVAAADADLARAKMVP